VRTGGRVVESKYGSLFHFPKERVGKEEGDKQKRVGMRLSAPF